MGLLSGAAVAVGSGLVSKLLNKKGGTTVRQGPLQTGPQSEAERILLDFAKSGKFGDFEIGGPLKGFTPGEAFKGPLGEFDPTEEETLGLGKLRGLLQGGLPSSFLEAKGTISDFLSTDRFDPFSETGEFAPFKRAVEQNLEEGKDRIKQNAAFTGNLFGTDVVDQLGQLEEEGQAALTGKLAQLFSEFTGRKLDAARTGADFGRLEEGINLGRVGASQQFGGLQRLLGNQKAQLELAEFLRQRGELSTEAGRIRGEEKIPLDILQGILGNKTQFGVPSVTLPSSGSPFDAVLQNLALAGGQEFGKKLFKA